MLHELQAQDRRVFEYWARAASYLPICDYRYYLPRMRAFAEDPKVRQWLQQNAQLVKNVIDRIRKEGPLGSTDFSAPPGFKRGGWFSRKPAKQALERFFWVGELMVAERKNFQRVYDLTERVLPAGTDTTEPDRGELVRFLIRRTLAGFGIASPDEIEWEIGGKISNRRRAISEAIEELVDSGEVTSVEIDGFDGKAYYALTKTVEETTKWLQNRVQPHILSPFDNLVSCRGRLRKLFDFEYKLESYLSPTKRRYGYFCLPILWDERFVGRLDSKTDRKQKAFIVRKLMFEPDFKNYDGFLPALAEKLRAFAAFNECEWVVIEQTVPGKARTPLMRELGTVVSSW